MNKALNLVRCGSHVCLVLYIESVKRSVFIMNTTEFNLVHNQKENCHYDHIRLNLKEIRKLLLKSLGSKHDDSIVAFTIGVLFLLTHMLDLFRLILLAMQRNSVRLFWLTPPSKSWQLRKTLKKVKFCHHDAERRQSLGELHALPFYVSQSRPKKSLS